VNSATKDPEVVKKWFGAYPDINYAVAGGDDSNLSLYDFDDLYDDDTNVDYSEAQFPGLHQSFRVRSGRVLKPGQVGGFHLYAAGACQSRALFADAAFPLTTRPGVKKDGSPLVDKNGNPMMQTFDNHDRLVVNGRVTIGEVRSRGEYVVGYGSHHKSGRDYELVIDAPLFPNPIQDVKVVHNTPAIGTAQQNEIAGYVENAFGKAKIEYKARQDYQGGFKWLVTCPWEHEHTGGKSLEDGGSSSAVFMAASGALGYRCLHAHCQSLRNWEQFRAQLRYLAGCKLSFKAKSAKSAPQTAADPNKESGPSPTAPEAVTTPTAEHRYPIEVWDGTLFQEYVALCRTNNHLPLEFFIEALKTVVGAICGHRIVPEDNFGQESRSYSTFLSLHAGDGKSETSKWTMNMMRATGLLYDSERPPLELQNIGAYIDTFASGRGMVEAFFRHPRILQWYDELSVMVEKFSITGSGASFMGLQTDLFESNFPPKSRIGGTKARPAGASLTCHNSVLACTIKEKRDAMYATSGAENSGWFPRENLIVTGEIEQVARLRVPDLTEIGEKLKNKILPLEYRRVLTFYSAAAQQLLDDWFLEMRQRTKNDSDDVKGRINVLAQRNASMLAWLLSDADQDQTLYGAEEDPEISYSPIDVRAEITEDTVRRAILLAEYTLAVRRDNQPIVADNTWAKCENIIKKHLCQRTRMARNVLYREANLSRFGIKIVNASLLNLVQGKLICIRNKPDVSVTGQGGSISDEEAVKLPNSIFQWMGDGRTTDDGWKEARGGDRKSPYFRPAAGKS
jgi:hypothetical protein